ncbi:hypothetical protein HMPREF9435_0452 [Gardnerella vaginalis 315-A]|nr:hypothetical protein HMPREF9435_0452 [Gardnerella vaginalis 315-A]
MQNLMAIFVNKAKQSAAAQAKTFTCLDRANDDLSCSAFVLNLGVF